MEHKKQIDHVLVNSRYEENLMDTRSRIGADADSGHFLHSGIRMRVKKNGNDSVGPRWGTLKPIIKEK